MAESPNKNAENIVRFTVYSEGAKIKDSFGIISVYIYRAVNRIGRCILKIDAGNMAQSEIPESEDNTFSPGKKINIEAGYGNDEKSIFQGIVTSHRLQIREGNECTLNIECSEYTFPMTQGRKSNVFTNQKDSEIISSIIGNYSCLKSCVESTSVTYIELVQYYCTDWDFILARAEANGQVIITDGNNIKIKAPEVNTEPVVKVTYGMDLIGFEGELVAEDQQRQITATGWNPTTQKTVVAVANPPSLNEQGDMSQKQLAQAAGNNEWTLQTAMCAGEDSLKLWASGQLLKSGLARIQGKVKFNGHADVIPGCIIGLDGLGKHFNGNAYLGSVEHQIRQGEWITTAGMGVPFENVTEKNDLMAPSASGLVPGIEGLQIGKVTKLIEDPAKEQRIQVEIPVLSGENKLIWARMGCGWASKTFGSFFIPDVGDEVVLGFFNNDPSYPVILGCLYSSQLNPPYELTEENYTRGIVTKEKMKLTFDEEKKVITLETPGANKVIIDDEGKGITLADQNGNKITMTDKGIIIESAKDMTLKAKMNINIEAGAAINQKAKTDFKAEGLNVGIKAQTALKVQGTASAEISASGQTTVKGAMVMIN